MDYAWLTIVRCCANNAFVVSDMYCKHLTQQTAWQQNDTQTYWYFVTCQLYAAQTLVLWYNHTADVVYISVRTTCNAWPQTVRLIKIMNQQHVHVLTLLCWAFVSHSWRSIEHFRLPEWEMVIWKPWRWLVGAWLFIITSAKDVGFSLSLSRKVVFSRRYIWLDFVRVPESALK